MFQPIKFAFKGTEYLIPPNRVLRAVAVVEAHVTMHELSIYMARQTAPSAKVAMAYAALVNFAGGAVTDDEVFESLFDPQTKENVMTLVSLLITVLVPPKAPDPNLPALPQMPAPALGGARKTKGKGRSKRSTKQ